MWIRQQSSARLLRWSRLVFGCLEIPISLPRQSKEATEESIIEELLSGVEQSISETTREILRRIVPKYSAVFSKSELNLVWTDIVTHTIDTGTAGLLSPLDNICGDIRRRISRLLTIT